MTGLGQVSLAGRRGVRLATTPLERTRSEILAARVRAVTAQRMATIAQSPAEMEFRRRQALLAREQAAAAYARGTIGPQPVQQRLRLAARGIPFGAPIERRREAITELARTQWAMWQPAPPYTPVPEREIAATPFVPERAPEPEWEVEPPPEDMIPPEFFQGEEVMDVPGGHIPVGWRSKMPFQPANGAPPAEVAEEEEAGGMDSWIRNLTLISLALGIITFFR